MDNHKNRDMKDLLGKFKKHDLSKTRDMENPSHHIHNNNGEVYLYIGEDQHYQLSLIHI